MDTFDLRLWPGFIAAGGDSSLPVFIDQVCIDSRRVESSRALFIPLKGENVDGHQFIAQAASSGARFALAEKKCPIRMPEGIQILRVENTLQALQEIASAYRSTLTTKVIAIIGSYGKTMVKDLLHTLLATRYAVGASPESFNSQIGVALSLLTLQRNHEIALIEAAVSEKEEMDRLVHMVRPDHTILTHVGKKHLATLGNLTDVSQEFVKMANALAQGNWALFPSSPILKPYLSKTSATKYFWDEPSQHLPHATALSSDSTSSMPYRIQFPEGAQFLHHTRSGFSYILDLMNITTKAAWLLHVPANKIQEVLLEYIVEPTRTEIWKSPTGITFINDSYSSDPQSVERSLKHLSQPLAKGKKVFLFNGIRNANHATYKQLGKCVKQASVDQLILVGKHPFNSLVEELSHTTETTYCDSHQDAILHMQKNLRNEDTVLIKGTHKQPLDIFTEAFNDSICTNQCFINLAAIESNITAIRCKLAPKTRIMVMVKALAYGTNDIRMSSFLASSGIDILGVSYVDEAVSLKRSGISQDVFVINAATYEVPKVVKWGLEVGVSNQELITLLAEEAHQQNKKVKVHLHIDTGMSRFGCRPEEALLLARHILSYPSLLLEGVMTHFACADDPESDIFTKRQIQLFDQAIKLLEDHKICIPWKHAANSSAVLRFHLPQYNMVRIGLAVYGLYPSNATKNALDLRLALSLLSRIVGINECHSGETISYGRTYTVKRPKERIAILPIGYFDGLHRNYSGKSYLLIRGQKAPMVGKICMDFMMVDITEIPQASIGDPVLIFGEDEYGHYLSPEDLAAAGDSIIYELITCLGPRIQRIFLHEYAQQHR